MVPRLLRPQAQSYAPLLLSNFDMGVFLASGTLQLGLQLSDTAKELFTGKEKGEDAISLLKAYLAAYARLRASFAAEIPLARTALRFARRIAAGARAPGQVSEAER